MRSGKEVEEEEEEEGGREVRKKDGVDSKGTRTTPFLRGGE